MVEDAEIRASALSWSGNELTEFLRAGWDVLQASLLL